MDRLMTGWQEADAVTLTVLCAWGALVAWAGLTWLASRLVALRHSLRRWRGAVDRTDWASEGNRR